LHRQVSVHTSSGIETSLRKRSGGDENVTTFLIPYYLFPFPHGGHGSRLLKKCQCIALLEQDEDRKIFAAQEFENFPYLEPLLKIMIEDGSIFSLLRKAGKQYDIYT
jgi:hypothetical protein